MIIIILRTWGMYCIEFPCELNYDVENGYLDVNYKNGHTLHVPSEEILAIHSL